MCLTSARSIQSMCKRHKLLFTKTPCEYMHCPLVSHNVLILYMDGLVSCWFSFDLELRSYLYIIFLHMFKQSRANYISLKSDMKFLFSAKVVSVKTWP